MKEGMEKGQKPGDGKEGKLVRVLRKVKRVRKTEGGRRRRTSFIRNLTKNKNNFEKH
jgi:hypothetical protein